MRQQLLLWAPFRRYRQHWGLYLATHQRVLIAARKIKLHKCDACGVLNPKDDFWGFTDYVNHRVLIDVTAPENKIADTAMHELLHVIRGDVVPEAPHDEDFICGAEPHMLHVLAQFGFGLPPFPERYAEFRAAALKEKRNRK